MQLFKKTPNFRVQGPTQKENLMYKNVFFLLFFLLRIIINTQARYFEGEVTYQTLDSLYT